MCESKYKYKEEILTNSMNRIFEQLFKLNDQRFKLKQLAFLAVGAMIGLALNIKVEANVLSISICYCGVVTAAIFWVQDQKLHKFQHSWRNVDNQIREYLSDPVSNSDFKLFDFKKKTVKKASWRSSLLIGTYGILIVGSLFTGIYKLSLVDFKNINLIDYQWLIFFALFPFGILLIIFAIIDNIKSKNETINTDNKISKPVSKEEAIPI